MPDRGLRPASRVQKGYDWLGAWSRSALRRLHNAFEASRQMPFLGGYSKGSRGRARHAPMLIDGAQTDHAPDFFRPGQSRHFWNGPLVWG
jgi:hypothetical protein